MGRQPHAPAGGGITQTTQLRGDLDQLLHPGGKKAQTKHELGALFHGCHVGENRRRFLPFQSLNRCCARSFGQDALRLIRRIFGFQYPDRD